MKKIILDTDLGCDSDDIGALVILNQLYNQKKVLPLCITSINSHLEPALLIAEINKYYGNQILIGMNKCNNYGIDNGYSVDVVNKFNISRDKDFPSSIDVIKKVLLAESGKIDLITVGPLTNIYYFIKNYGVELLNEKVDTMYLMAGNFASNTTEWNISEDIEAFLLVLKEFKGKMVFIPFEIGYDVLTARNLLNSDTMMGYGYYVHNQGPRPSWDPITVYYAITLSDEFTLSEAGVVSCNEKGVTTFSKGKGNHYYMLNNFDKARIEKVLEELMVI